MTHRSIVRLRNDAVVVGARDLENGRLLRVQALGVGVEGKSSGGRDESGRAHHGRSVRLERL
jgi:hypothetical protein